MTQSCQEIMINIYNPRILFLVLCLVGVGQTTHAAHNSQHIIICGVHTNLGGLGAFHSCIRQDKLKGSVVNTREVARATWLMFLRSQCKRIHVDALIGRTGMCLVRLDEGEVSSLTLGEAVLSVELELGSNHGVKSPTMHIQRSLS